MEDQHRADRNDIKELLANRAYSSAAFNNEKIRRSRDFEFFGVTQSRTGTPETAKAIKIILSSGEQLVIKYHEVGCPITYDGTGKIEFTIAGTSKITIHGNNLEAILDYLAEERLMWIKEPESSKDLFWEYSENNQNVDFVVISSIIIDTIN